MPSRIGYEQLPPELQSRLEARVARLGYLGEFFQVAAHQPRALAGFIDYTEALKDALPDRLVEVIALTAATATANDYERVQHERLALRLGFTEEEVRALVTDGGSLDAFSAAERAAIALAREVCAARGGACRSYEQVEQLVGEEVAVGCLMTAVRYLAHATMANTWGLAAPVPSPLAAGSKRV
jgi:alkylhydroperoxidase family enzyme